MMQSASNTGFELAANRLTRVHKLALEALHCQVGIRVYPAPRLISMSKRQYKDDPKTDSQECILNHREHGYAPSRECLLLWAIGGGVFLQHTPNKARHSPLDVEKAGFAM